MIAVDSPDYLPARMLNEFVYCPRLFYYEWVEGVFVHNRETVEGALRHSKLDDHTDELVPAEELTPDDRLHSRSITLSSDTHGLIAKLDLIEVAENTVTPVDYKRGTPRKNAETGLPEAWDADRVQLAAQALVLRDNGYACHEGVIYYVSTKQRVRVPIDEQLVAETVAALANARVAAASDEIPPPLVDCPKCPRCSLVGICLPDETWACHSADGQNGHGRQRTLFNVGLASIPTTTAEMEPRRLVAARDDLRPLYLNAQGLHVGKSGNVLKVKEKDKVVQEVRIGETCQVNVFGNIQISTQALQALCEGEVPIAYFSMGGWFYGFTHGLGVKNVYLRREQFRLADVAGFRLRLARSLVAGKIRNQRTMLQRNHIEPPSGSIAHLKCMQEQADNATSIEELLGIEGNAARIYFEHFAGMIKTDETGNGSPHGNPEFTFDFLRRNRRPPRDPVNALLSLGY